jgi:hypothetical protein
MRRSVAVLGVLALLLAVSCDGPTGLPGALQVNVTTTGGDFDLDGYGVSVNGVPREVVGVNASVTLADLAPG